MKDPVGVQVAVHEAQTAELVGTILREFFDSLTEQEKRALGTNLSTIATLSNRSSGNTRSWRRGGR